MDRDAWGRPWEGCVFVGVSLDGFIARADGDIAWLTDPPPREHAASATDHPAHVWDTFFPGVDAVVMGRETYATVAGFDVWPFERKDVIVLSSTLGPTDRVMVARTLDDVAEMLHDLGARRVYIDGGRTIQSFLAAGLIDEITVAIVPVLLGSGRRLFGDVDRDVMLTLRGHHSTPGDGLVHITYTVEHGGGQGADDVATPPQ
ncbi:MAG TPA: dihydrofolate reductase family protein [Actinomycetaceae bacterium]|nr:dihydrofolate reductase family protein [Actinomycetaceae bacterium]